MKCDNHPAVAAVGVCALCDTCLCGICARFVGDSIYCEKCEQLSALNQSANARSRPGKQPDKSAMAGLLREEEERQRNQPTPEPRSKPDNRERNEKIQMAIVIVCCVFIVYQIASSISSGGMLNQQEIIAQETRRNQIEACMLVFWEIAMQFSNGQQPGGTLRCPHTETPLQVARQNGDVIVRHPRPSAPGVSEIYVRRSDPTPVLVE